MSLEPPNKLAFTQQTAFANGAAPDRRDVLRWHAGWAIGVYAAGLVLSLSRTQDFWTIAPALGVGLIPTFAAASLFPWDRARTREMLLVVWAMAGAVSCGLTGGVSGPLAIWCAAPMVAAVVLGGARRLSQGAALSLLAVAVTALAQADKLVGAAPAGAVNLGLGMIGVSSISIGLATALLAGRRRTPEVAASPPAEAPRPADDGLRAILNEQPYLIVTLGADGRVEAVFGEAFQFLVPAERLRGSGLLAIAEGAERTALEAALAAALDRGQAAATFRLAGADQVWFAIELRRVTASRLIAVLRNATAEQMRLAALEKARADAEALNIGKSRFLANMSHELRTPLNAIMGFSDIMRQRMFGALPARYSEYADLIHDAGAHLLDLINDVLDMSKIEAARYELSLERLDAREPVQAALRLMRLQADDAGVQLRGVLPNQPLDLDADRRAIKQISLNLISNALKFTPKGGLVTVTLHSLAGAMELTVADTGLGIAASDLQRLGQPFEQAGDSLSQGKGTGLGLSLVRAFAELHGGEMMIESRLGEGTAVTVRLPMPTSTGSREDARGDAGGKVIAFSPQR